MLSNDLVQQWPRGQLFVVSAPAGAGKTTIVKHVTSAFPSVVQIPSLTTRPRRVHEVEGVDYHFVSKAEFVHRQSQGELLEQIELHGYLYGTSRKDIESERTSGHHVILVIDTRGALEIRDELQPVSIFIKPPSMEVLQQRLCHRGTEDEATMERRLAWAQRELADEKYFHYTIVNDELSRACDVLASIIIAESHKVQR